MRPHRLALFLALFIVCAARPAAADIPLPGAHSAVPKYWSSAKRWVINFTPYDFQGPLVGLVSDGNRGVWFGSGSTIEHIERSGHIFQATTGHYLWQVWSLARDPRGRLWFSLGQSGRIGTVDGDGRIRTRIVVPRRFFPDLRTIAFASDGTLWFEDAGRNSVGYRRPNGVVGESPSPVEATSFAYCQGRAWIAGNGAIFEFGAALRGSQRIVSWRSGVVQLACDREGRLWYTQQNDSASGEYGFIDARHRMHRLDTDVAANTLSAAEDGTVWIESTTPNNRTRLVDWLGARRRSDWTLPFENEFWYKGTFTSTPDGTVWLGLAAPYSVVRMTTAR